MKNHKSFLYAAYEQQFLEYIEHHEIQKVSSDSQRHSHTFKNDLNHWNIFKGHLPNSEIYAIYLLPNLYKMSRLSKTGKELLHPGTTN
jgi:hypothetical protein